MVGNGCCCCIFVVQERINTILSAFGKMTEPFVSLFVFLYAILVISIKQSEGNYVQVSSEVANLIADYNKLLCTALSGPHVLNT